MHQLNGIMNYIKHRILKMKDNDIIMLQSLNTIYALVNKV